MPPNIGRLFSGLIKSSRRRSISGERLIKEAFKGLPADPYSAERSELDLLKLEIDLSPEDYLDKTEPLRDSDLTLMGKIIQSYCFADLNARRIIDIIRLAEGGPGKQNGGRIADSQVFEKLLEVAKLLEPAQVKDGIIKAVNTIAMHVNQRHTFAHWAARRLIGRDVLILLTYNAREAEKRDGKKNGPGEMKYALAPLGPIVAELTKIERHGEYLAHAAAYLNSQAENLRMYFVVKEKLLSDKKYEAGVEKGRMKSERKHRQTT